MKLVYGRAGTGKTEYIFKDINEKITNGNVKEKIYIITPEQFSFTAEKKLLSTLEKEIKSVENSKNKTMKEFNEIYQEKFFNFFCEILRGYE